MSTSTITKKAFALAAAAGLSLSLSPLMVGTASAATASKTIKSSCRTNGAPMNFNETREKTDVIDVSAPDQVKVGEEYEVRVNYKPEMIPGKESIAVIKSADDVVMRLTIDDPSSFVTASLEGSGAVLKGTPKISLVGGKTLVVSGFGVAVEGKDANWAVPTIVMKMKASKAGKIGTVHPAVEGPAGEFNNPQNFVTMRNVVDTQVIGTQHISLNCQALSGPATLLSVNAVGGSADAAKADDKKADDKKADKKADNKADAKKGTESSKAAPSTDASGMEVLDEDPYKDTPTDDGGLSGGAIAGIVILCLAVAGGIGYGIYRARNKKKGEA
ncbi:hypothetical protein [uncultured Lawsonella sp.]|uniref:hypothetical protein n=1 Tax=uncultured Lawsonella sp. TaxID=1847727 RepID=UPI0025EAF37C|nr:hypothetical protein [uncultured Lawsonella sp.]